MSKIKKKILIVLEGESDEQFEAALEEAACLIQQGFLEGFDQNDSSSFYFKVHVSFIEEDKKEN